MPPRSPWTARTSRSPITAATGCWEPSTTSSWPARPRPRRGTCSVASRAFSVVVYAVLFVLGAFEGIVGSFHYSQPPAPWIAVLLVLALFTSCLLAAVGTESFRGMVMVAIGWAIAAFLLSMGSHAGSVIITATTAG